MALVLDISVVPASGQQKLMIDTQGRLKCYLKSPPEKGKANAELVKFMSKSLGYPQDDVEIIGGEISRKKRLKIHKDITYDQFKELLGLADSEEIILVGISMAQFTWKGIGLMGLINLAFSKHGHVSSLMHSY